MTAVPGQVSWKVAGASVAGFSHVDAGNPCQDAHSTAILPGGWFVGVVSDGAGSARRSEEGARRLCDDVVAALAAQLAAQTRDGVTGPEEALVKSWVEEAVEQVRRRLGEIADDRPDAIDDFHATLVGAIAGPAGGVFFHIGDGAALATCIGDLATAVVSPPENGEYANETYFFTQHDWRAHLRTMAFGAQFDLIALMSDGVMPFALARGAKSASSPFFEPVSHYLAAHGREDGERELIALLQRDAIRDVTDDDKTLVWASRIAV